MNFVLLIFPSSQEHVDLDLAPWLCPCLLRSPVGPKGLIGWHQELSFNIALQSAPNTAEAWNLRICHLSRKRMVTLGPTNVLKRWTRSLPALKKCRKWSLEACQILAYVDYFFSGKWRVPTSPIIQKPFVFYSSTKFIQIVPKWQLAVKSSGLFCTATLHLATAEENWLMTTDICTSLFQLGPCCDATSSVQACSTEVGQSCICSH